MARDIRTLTQWLGRDVLALGWPAPATRQALFDFIVGELAHRKPEDARHISPAQVALQNQRDDLLAFARVLDGKLAAIAKHIKSPSPWCVKRAFCTVCRTPRPLTDRGGNRLRAKTGYKFHTLFDAVSQAMAQTPRSSSLVENLSWGLRCHVGGSYLDLLQLFLNYRRLMPS